MLGGTSPSSEPSALHASRLSYSPPSRKPRAPLPGKVPRAEGSKADKPPLEPVTTLGLCLHSLRAETLLSVLSVTQQAFRLKHDAYAGQNKGLFSSKGRVLRLQITLSSVWSLLVY